MRRMRLLAYPYSVWMAIFIVVPLILVLLYSFTEGDIRNLAALRFSTRSYERVLEPIYLKVIVNSFVLATISTLCCLVLGYPVAMIVSRANPKVRGMLLMFLIVPMWMNFLLRTYAWMSILSPNGFLNRLLELVGLPKLEIMPGKTAVLLGMIYNFLPFMILPIYTVLSKIDKQYLEAANDLGANKARTFFKIILPLSVPGVVSGITMVFLPAVSTFVISGLLGGGKTPLIGDLIEQQFMWEGNWHFGSSLSIILMVMILISMAIMSRIDRNGKQDENGRAKA
ncbi:MAG TPA: ABC transporter permease [Thermoclostridium sp.]|nr:ABC transporter permease [Clostridiaceae bacterium]HOQ75959.1 ABC transporter permease [Thermoclostridium sp.]